MIKENEATKLVIRINNKDYIISNDDDYQDLVLILTDPCFSLDPNIEIDKSISEENKAAAENYKNFINDFLCKKIELLKQNNLITDNNE